MSDVQTKGKLVVDKPMVITQATNDATTVMVKWVKVAYTGCDGYLVSIYTGQTKLDNFRTDDPAATSATVPFTCVAGKVYSAVVEPIIRGLPKDSLCSDPVTIPYPATK